jgi:fructuronate reductase
VATDTSSIVRTPPCLSRSRLAALPAAVQKPLYDSRAITPGIVHIGLGSFSRAHLAVYTDDVLARGARDWGIIGTDLLSTSLRDALQPQDWLYTLLVRGDEGDQARIIGSLTDVLACAVDPEPALRTMCDPRIRIVTLTVTEKGYCQDAATGALDESHPLIRADLARTAPPRSVPALLAEAIRRRRAAGEAPFTVLVCDNLSQNGAKVKRIVSRFAALVDADLGAYVSDAIAFPCTMVDRITPATRDEDRAQLLAAHGYQDAWPVVTEPFRQWVIEDNFPLGRPRWEEAGAIFVNDVHAFEEMKLRCLNGAHSALAYIGTLAGFETVASAMGDPTLSAFIHRLWAEDLVPTVPPVPGTDIGHYTVELERRFRNAAIRHLTLQIAMDGSQKLPPRLLEPALDRLHAGGSARCVAFVVAAWMHFLGGRTDAGVQYGVSDPMSARLQAIAEAPDRLVGELFALSDIFPPEIAACQPFRMLVETNLRAIRHTGIKAALAGFMSQA